MAACAAPPGGRVSDTAGAGIIITPDDGGLSVDGTGMRIDFGRAPAGVIAALDRDLGRSTELSLAGCPAGIVSQRSWGALVLTFSAERFVGWRKGAQTVGQSCSVSP